jgi:predicted enzyme related to lactoylglutathione lyase
MKKLFTRLAILALFVSCDSQAKKVSEEPAELAQAKVDTTTPKVLGVGGIFFYSDNPSETKDWYSKNMGIEMNDWGSSSFESRDINNPEKVNSLQWKPFKTGDEYFSPSKKDFMINYQVQQIEALVEKLRKNGVTILDSIESFDYGKFVHILDGEGRKVELWEATGN